MRTALLLWVLLALAPGSSVWGQGEGANELIQKMIALMLANNPTLASQQTLVRESEKLPTAWSGFALTGASLTGATSFWDVDTSSFRFYPAITIGASFSIRDPVRLLNSYNLKKERETARQEYQKIKNSLIAELLSAVGEILKIANRKESLAELKAYLEDYGDLLEKQMRAGIAAPELEKLWNLKERILGLEAEIQEAENQLNTKRLGAAMSLGGEAWVELLELLSRLGSRG